MPHMDSAGAKGHCFIDEKPNPAERHQLRYSDIRKVSLWLGHASLQSTEEAMASLVPPTLRRGRFRPPDKLLAMLRPKQ